MNPLKTKILDGKRIDAAEALSLFELDLAELGLLADARRRLAKPDNEVGFIVDRIVNYTNVCAAKCAFCAYHAKAGQIAAYELSLDEILAKVSELGRVIVGAIHGRDRPGADHVRAGCAVERGAPAVAEVQ